MNETKICSGKNGCGQTKNIEEFSKTGSYCKKCNKIYTKQYYKINKKLLNSASKNYYENNKNAGLSYAKEYREKNKVEIATKNKKYRSENEKTLKIKRINYIANNKEKVDKSKNAWERNKRKLDPAFRMRKDISRIISRTLKFNQSSKFGESILNFLEYTLDILKSHIESLFEPWMNWSNKGVYKLKDWNDNDQSTWTWQIDHIIPQSDLPYTSMEEENFKKCWALSNLRPYSAKKNLEDGVKKIRHLKGEK